MNFQVTGLALDKMKLDSPHSFLDSEEVEEAEDQQLLEPEAVITGLKASWRFLSSSLDRRVERQKSLSPCGLSQPARLKGLMPSPSPQDG